MHQTQRQEGVPHLHRVPGAPSGALPRPDGERAREASRLRLPPGLRALPGTLQNALQTDLAPLARARQVTAAFVSKVVANCEAAAGGEAMKEFCRWKDAKVLCEKKTSVEAEKCSPVLLNKAVNLRLHPGE